MALLSPHEGMQTDVGRAIDPSSVLVRRGNATRVAPRGCLLRDNGATGYVSMTVLTRKCAPRRVPMFCRSTTVTYRDLFTRRPFQSVGGRFGVMTITDPSRSDKMDMPHLKR